MQTVAIPWRPESSALRKEACRRVVEHLIAGKFGPLLANAHPWSPGAARNRGAELSYGDVYVFNDADTLVSYDQIHEAVELARRAPGLVYAYRGYIRLTEEFRQGRTLFDPPSLACVAINAACFEEVGGFDERFTGWGYEDCDFARRCLERWPLRRVEGIATHYWHGERNEDDSPDDSDPEEVAANLALWTSTV